MNYCMRSCRSLPSSRGSAEFDPANATTSLFYSLISWETIGDAFMATSNLLAQHAAPVMADGPRLRVNGVIAFNDLCMRVNP